MAAPSQNPRSNSKRPRRLPSTPCSPCCAVWPKFVEHFEWLRDPDRNRALPHVTVDGVMWRVNHCPSCGKDIRGIIISEENGEDWHPSPRRFVVHVILGISGGVNGVDQLRLDLN
jgi:hypothetical protein